MYRSVRMKAVLSLTALAAVLAPATAAAQGTKLFDFKVTPHEVGQRSDATLTATITNASPVATGHKLGSANITVPPEFDIHKVHTPTTGTGTRTGRIIELRYLSLAPKESVSVDIDVTAPATAGDYPLTAAVKGSQTFASTEKESTWSPNLIASNVNVSSTHETQKNCDDVPVNQPCTVRERHTVPSSWLGGGADALTVDDLYVETTVTAPGGSDGFLTLRYLDPYSTDPQYAQERAANEGSACNGLDNDNPFQPPHVEPSDAAALFDGPDGVTKTLVYEISNDLWQQVRARQGSLGACFSAPFFFLATPFDPVFTGPSGGSWFNGMLPNCVPNQPNGPCVSGRSEPLPTDTTTPARVSITVHPPAFGGSDPMNR